MRPRNPLAPASRTGRQRPDSRRITQWTPAWRDALDANRRAAPGCALRAAPRPFYGRTAIGSAIGFAADLLARAPFRADRRVIDISGDGTGNAGRPIAEARDAAVAAGITVNGIVILTEPEGMPAFLKEHTNPAGGLAAYYRSVVIGGEGAFVMTAESFAAFGRSLVAKLVREIS